MQLRTLFFYWIIYFKSSQKGTYQIFSSRSPPGPKACPQVPQRVQGPVQRWLPGFLPDSFQYVCSQESALLYQLKKHVTCFNSDQSSSDSVFLLLLSDVFIWLTDACKHKHTQTTRYFFKFNIKIKHIADSFSTFLSQLCHWVSECERERHCVYGLKAVRVVPVLDVNSDSYHFCEAYLFCSQGINIHANHFYHANHRLYA